MKEDDIIQKASLDDEIDLKYLVEGILKRKKIILIALIFSIVFVSFAVIKESSRPKMAEVSMMIELPILGIQETGAISYIDSPDNLMRKIENGAFNHNLIKRLAEHSQIGNISFKASLVKGSKLIKVHLIKQIEDRELAVKVLNQLFIEISHYYNQMLGPKKESIQGQIDIILNNVTAKSYQVKQQKNQIKLLEEREALLKDKIKIVQVDMDKLSAKRDSLIDSVVLDDEKALLYASVMQQNIMYINQMQKEVFDLRAQKENNRHINERLENDITNIKITAKKLNAIKENIQNIKMIQEPYISQALVERNIKKHLINAAALSLVFIIFLVFAVDKWPKK